MDLQIQKHHSRMILDLDRVTGNETTDNAVNRVLPQMQQTAQRLRKLLWKISGMDRS
jgi:hypothetical protein